MTYKEALEEAEFRLDEFCGIGKHTDPMMAMNAYAEACSALAKLDAAIAALHKELEEKGYECFFIKE